MPNGLIDRSVLTHLTAVLAAVLSGCATPGVGAAVRRDPAALKRILDRPNHGGENLDNLLTNSVGFDCEDCARLLIKAGAKPDANLLSVAALDGHQALAQLLIDAGADPAAAIAVVHGETRKWVGGDGISPAQARVALDLLKKIERENPSPGPAPLPAAAAPAVAAWTRAPGPPETPSFQGPRRPDDYAVVVGVEKYDDLPSSPYAERDAAAAAELMKALGVQARNLATLTGAHATRSWMAKHVEGWLADNVDENSTVYFYFAGAGASDPKSGLAYLVPSDGDPRYLEQTAYPLKRLYEKLGALKAKRAIVLLEAGFPGPAGPDAGFNSVDGKVALLAAGAIRSPETDEDKGYGLFTAGLLEGLDGAAKTPAGRVTLKSLFDYLKPKVSAGARRAGREQVPLFESGGTATDGVVLRAN